MSTLSSYLQIGRQERKLFLMDSRYPTLHLTISWNNPSGEVDIHLTREFPDKPKIHGSIAKIPEASIKEFIESFAQKLAAGAMPVIISFLEKIKPIRPGWLGRKGYLIFWVPEGDETQWITKFAHRHKKNKYRVYQSTLDNLNYSEEVIEHIYEPTILHELAARGERGWIQALRIRGRKKRQRRTINLTSIPWSNGNVRWIALDELAAAFLGIMGSMEDSVLQPLIAKLRDALGRVYDELSLHELGIERDRFTSL
jgi:hypothetical protein